MGNCLFCKNVINNPNALVIYKDEHVVVFLDKFPRTKGHCIVAPAVHFSDIYSIPSDVRMNVFKHLGLCCDVLKEYGAKGINIGANIGEIAGQQVQHFHFHVIPRYVKDDAKEIEPAFINTPWRQKQLELSDEEMIEICNNIKELYLKRVK